MNIFAEGDNILASKFNENFNILYSYIFGDGSDGDVTLSGDTTLTEDKEYNDLTIQTGVTLYTKGFRIKVNGTLTYEGTAKIASSGGAGGNGTDAADNETPGVGGSAGSSPHDNNDTLPYPALSPGADGVYSGRDSDGTVSVNGISVTGNSYNKTIIEGAAPSGGNAGNSNLASGGSSSSGNNLTTRKEITLLTIFNDLIDNNQGSADPLYPMPSNSGGASGGASDDDYNDNGRATSGGGGGAGAHGGFIYIAARNIIINTNHIYLESKGGVGGDAGTGIGSTSSSGQSSSGGSGGGAGGSGGVVMEIYITKTGTGSANLSGGLGGSGSSGVGYSSSSGEDGGDGLTGSQIEIII